MIKNKIVFRYKGIEQEEFDIPSGQMDEVRNRMKDFKDHPEQAMDFDAAMDEIEADL